MTISRYILLRMEHVLDKSLRENQNTHFMLNNILQKSCRVWYNVEKCGTREATNDDTTWGIRVTCWKNKTTRASTRLRARKLTCTHTRSDEHAHAHRNMQYLLLLDGNNDSQTRFNVTLYVHCRSCFLFDIHRMFFAQQINATSRDPLPFISYLLRFVSLPYGVF